MLPTVTAAPLRQDRSSEKEKTDLPNDLRRAVNLTSRARVQIPTAHSGAYTTIWTSDIIAEGVACAINAYVVGIGLGARARYARTALFYRDPLGALTQEGATGDLAPPIESSAAMDARFLIVGNTIQVQVRDDGVIGVDWDVLVEAWEVR